MRKETLSILLLLLFISACSKAQIVEKNTEKTPDSIVFVEFFDPATSSYSDVNITLSYIRNILNQTSPECNNTEISLYSGSKTKSCYPNVCSIVYEFTLIGDLGKPNYNFCEWAIRENNSAHCKIISSSLSEDYCYLAFSFYYNDPSTCQYVKSEEVKRVCTP